ncbi:hypothetical protein GCM10010112_70500 [Actinoplanes lobatus]|uniref:Uncharacterized protein n=1 Tax=Actinoplanes lobatus TaxID=113568 RepID=A0A7W7MJS4_9ACTN|nr:hypothetical protein [Actinoplanes lobatus]MBB4752972.1 hypothetical protein [Actinoplanes lobatus]GGN87636.1 hypothetical protein GCM10010112_70500 [Actinoplanes lobatus]GIE39579.1 hypothetical protein Alo02nite_24770 [Actinoplanes lobatus]
MSASDWPHAEPTLERVYRRLLHAYPRPYRRRHGAEIVTTLLEMAEPGQQRPRLADSWHLIASGLRQRFRLPHRPLAWAAAVLALLAGGAFGAAAGSWAAAQTLADLPGPAQTLALHQVAAGATGGQVSLNLTSGAPISGPESFATTTFTTTTPWDTRQAQTRLAADGWRIGPPPQNHARFEAVRDGLTVLVFGSSDATRTAVLTSTTALDNGWLRPLTVLGLLAGATAGWLIAAAVTQRRSRPATVAALATFAALTLPVWAVYDSTVATLLHPGHGFVAHTVLWPSYFWPVEPIWLNTACAFTGLALAAITLALSLVGQHPATTISRQVAL